MKKILCLDGGGIRGLIQAVVCREIENRTGNRIGELFDFIAGTSVGGINALGFSKPDPMAGEDLVTLYEKRGNEIFDRSCWDRIQSAGGLGDEKYPSDGIEGILKEYFGAVDLRSATIPTLITAYETVSRQPFFFKSWEAQRFSEKNFKMWEAARATSAAPTYFEPFKLQRRDSFSLIDGGVFANNPTMCAYADALRLFGDEGFVFVSIGTGDNQRPLPHESIKDWGAVSWIQPALSIMMGGVSRSTHYQAKHILASSDQRNRYFRFQLDLPEANDRMDDASEENITGLLSLGRTLIENESAKLSGLIDLLK